MTEINRFKSEEFLSGLHDDLRIKQVMEELDGLDSSQHGVSPGKSTDAFQFSSDDWSKPAYLYDQFKKDLDINELAGGIVNIYELTDYNVAKDAVQSTEKGSYEEYSILSSISYKEFEENLYANYGYNNENRITLQDLINDLRAAKDEAPPYIEGKSDAGAEENWNYSYGETLEGTGAFIIQASEKSIFGPDPAEKLAEKNINVTASYTHVYISRQANNFSQ